MYISYQQLMSLSSMKKVTLIAGEGGLVKSVAWSQVLEFDDIEEWVYPNAIIFVTGVASNQWNKGIFEIVSQAIKKNAAGMIFYIGPYIEKIPEEVIAFCNEKDFPLFTAPIEVKTYEVSYQIGAAIFANQENIRMIESVISDVYLDRINDLTSQIMEKLGLIDNYYQSMLIRYSGKGNEAKDYKLEIAGNIIESYFSQYNIKLIKKVNYNSLVLLLAYSDANESNRIVQKCFDKIKNYSILQIEGEFIYGACGDPIESVSDLGKNMKRTILTRGLAEKNCLDSKLYRYKDIGIYRILCAADVEREKRTYIEDYLGCLTEPENEELLKSLISYVDNGLNITKSSEELFIHVNTMKYRIKHIEEMLGVSFKDIKNIYNIYIALAIWKLEKK